MQNLTKQARKTQIAHAVQQRHILAQMGIDCWISKQTFDEKSTQPVNELLVQLQTFANSGQSGQLTEVSQTASTSTAFTLNKGLAQPAVENIESKESVATDVTQNGISGTSDISNSGNSDEAKENDFSIVEESPVVEESSIHATSNKINTAVLQEANLIVPFELQGISFGNWVLLVDMEVIEEQELALWQNICRGLQLETQTLKFPLVSNMNTVEIANSIMGGFIFRLYKEDNKQKQHAINHDNIKLAGLTTMPRWAD